MKNRLLISIIEDLLFIISVMNHKKATAKEKKSIDFLIKDIGEKLTKLKE